MKWERLRKEHGLEGNHEFGIRVSHVVSRRYLCETGEGEVWLDTLVWEPLEFRWYLKFGG